MSMKIFKFIFFISLAAFPKIIESSSINETTFAFWDKADVQLFYIKPDKVDKNTQFLFVIHGNSRNAKDYLKAWIPYIKNKNIIVVAPRFEKKYFRYFFLLQTANSSGELNVNEKDYIDDSLSLFFNYFKDRYSLDINKYKIFGHSAGAQFAHRYMLLSNDYRISNVVLANAGWYTFLDNNKFPYGITKSPIKITSERVRWFMSNKTSLLIGSEDIDLKSVNDSPGANNQGRTRVDRANNYFNNLALIGEKNNVPFRWKFYEIKGVDHDYKKMSQAAQNILLNDVAGNDFN